MLIKAFCEATGLSRDTVRFYVKRGLLTPGVGSRQSNSYQVFDAVQVERARLVRAAQRVGFTLAEIAELAQAYESGSLDRERKAALLRSRLAALEERSHLLRDVQAYLAVKLDWVERGEIGPAPGFGRAPPKPTRAATHQSRQAIPRRGTATPGRA